MVEAYLKNVLSKHVSNSSRIRLLAKFTRHPPSLGIAQYPDLGEVLSPLDQLNPPSWAQLIPARELFPAQQQQSKLPFPFHSLHMPFFPAYPSDPELLAFPRSLGVARLLQLHVRDSGLRPLRHLLL